MNTILWVLITEARWIDVPVGPRWAPRSTTHEWLGRWQETRLLEKVLNLLLDKAEGLKLTGFDRLKVDGFFSQGRGGEEEEVAYGYKGKGVTNHLLVDTLGNPIAIETTAANISERDQVVFLLQKMDQFVKPLISRGIIPFVKNKFINSARLLPAILCLHSGQLIQASHLAPGFGSR